MRWFGESWDSPINKSNEEAEAPIGRACAFCDNPIKKGQPGLLLPSSEGFEEQPHHLLCLLRAIDLK